VIEDLIQKKEFLVKSVLFLFHRGPQRKCTEDYRDDFRGGIRLKKQYKVKEIVCKYPFDGL
jgi:hypothetical protein